MTRDDSYYVQLRCVGGTMSGRWVEVLESNRLLYCLPPRTLSLLEGPCANNSAAAEVAYQVYVRRTYRRGSREEDFMVLSGTPEEEVVAEVTRLWDQEVRS